MQKLMSRQLMPKIFPAELGPKLDLSHIASKSQRRQIRTGGRPFYLFFLCSRPLPPPRKIAVEK